MKVYALTALWAVAVSAGLATAQQAGQDRDQNSQPGATRQGAGAEATAGRQAGRERAGQSSQHDQIFAQMLAIDNAVEVQVSEIAARQLQSEEVKRFAQQMVEDHRQMIQQLQQFGAQEVMLRNEAGERGGAQGNRPGTTGTSSQARTETTDQTAAAGQTTANQGTSGQGVAGQATERTGTAQAGQTGNRAGAADAHGEMASMIEVKREIAEQCVQSAQEELASKTGREADRCYVAAQVFNHQHMLNTLTVLERHASPEMQQVLKQAAQTTRQHLDHAKQLLSTLEGEGGAAGERPGQGQNSGTRERSNQ